MDYSKLLERYLEGRTTLDEERALRRWQDAPEWLRAMSGALRAETRSVAAPVRRRRLWSVPAAAAVVLGALLMWQLSRDQIIYGYANGKPITDFETAYTHTQHALDLLQTNMQAPENMMEILI